MTNEDHELTFSEANGYADRPAPLKLEELPQEARNRIWSVLYVHLNGATNHGFGDKSPLVDRWRDVASDIHTRYFGEPIDEWNRSLISNVGVLKPYIQNSTFNKVLDLVQFVMRHRDCPAAFVEDIRQAFRECRLAYIVMLVPVPTVAPAATPAEGEQIEEAAVSLEEAGLSASVFHLGKAAEGVNKGDWADSVRESIHAVESVARQIAPETRALGQALNAIDRGSLHPALKEGFKKIYGYTCDEQGVRHPLLDKDAPSVTVDDAVFMLGACASFASYLWRKHVAAGGP